MWSYRYTVVLYNQPITIIRNHPEWQHYSLMVRNWSESFVWSYKYKALNTKL